MHSALLLALIGGHFRPIFGHPTPPLQTLPGPVLDTIHPENPTNPIDQGELSDAVKEITFPVTGGPVNLHGRHDAGRPGFPLHIGIPVDPSKGNMVEGLQEIEQDANADGFKPNILKRQLTLLENPSGALDLSGEALAIAKSVAAQNGVKPGELVPRDAQAGFPGSTDIGGPLDGPTDTVLGLTGGLLGDDTLDGDFERRDLAGAVLKMVPVTGVLSDANKVGESGLHTAGLSSDDVTTLGLAEGDAVRGALVPRDDGDGARLDVVPGLLGDEGRFDDAPDTLQEAAEAADLLDSVTQEVNDAAAGAYDDVSSGFVARDSGRGGARLDVLSGLSGGEDRFDDPSDTLREIIPSGLRNSVGGDMIDSAAELLTRDGHRGDARLDVLPGLLDNDEDEARTFPLADPFGADVLPEDGSFGDDSDDTVAFESRDDGSGARLDVLSGLFDSEQDDDSSLLPEGLLNGNEVFEQDELSDLDNVLDSSMVIRDGSRGGARLDILSGLLDDGEGVEEDVIPEPGFFGVESS